MLDSLVKALISPERSASSHLMRLLAFLACLATHASIKAAIIQLTIRPAAPDKVQQRYPDLVVSLCHVLRAPHDSPTHVQAQVLDSRLKRGSANCNVQPLVTHHLSTVHRLTTFITQDIFLKGCHLEFALGQKCSKNK